MLLSEEYVAAKFFQFAGAPTKNKYNSTYQGSCPMCKEGKSWLKKRRFYFISGKDLVFCHNCGYNKNSLNWLMDITGLTYNEILNESGSNYIDFNQKPVLKETFKVETLPKDSINLFDDNQVSFYNGKVTPVSKALDYLKSRHLLDAVNKPKAFYLSLTDYVHKNRIIIPFYDEGKIVTYQSRVFLPEDTISKPRYLSKVNSDKTLFNFDRVDPNHPFIYIFEGPFNSCFTKNGVAVAGIRANSYDLFTHKQEEQLTKLPLHNRIWILDSQWIDESAYIKSIKLLELGETVFLWPKKVGTKIKDFNDLAIKLNVNEITTNWIHKNLISGESGLKCLKETVKGEKS